MTEPKNEASRLQRPRRQRQGTPLPAGQAMPVLRPRGATLALAVAAVCAPVVTAVFAPAVAQAQAPAPAETSDRVLDAVVVTASGTEQALKDAPATISVITREQIERQPYTDVTDVVRQLPGVNITAGSPNETDISIRGLPGEYTLILVDGKRQNTRETMNRGTTGVQANLLPPLAAIERIEVVRGPMSSLYGSDAMGGVINIITRKVPDRWTGSASIGTTIHEDSTYGNGSEGEFWLGGPIRDKVLGLQVYGRKSHRGEDDIFYPTPIVSGANGTSDYRYGAKLTFRPSDQHEFELDASTEALEYRRTAGRSANPTGASTRTEYGRDSFGLTHTGRWAFGKSTLSIYREVADQRNWSNGARTTVTPEVTNSVIDGSVAVPFGNHLIRTGAQYLKAEVEGIARQDAVQGLPANADKVSIDSWALFLEDDYAITDRFTLTAGARVDHDDRYGNEFSPRIYGVYQIDGNWTLRGGLAEGFKAPTVRQSVGGYCMTTGGGTQAQGTLCGNPDLKPETSFTQEIGVAWAPGGGVSASATLFNNRFRNKVASYDTGVPDPRAAGRSIYVYDNIARVNLRGIELAYATPINRTLSFSGSYTYTDSRRKGGGEYAFDGSSLDGYPLDLTPDHMLKTQLNWQATSSLDSFVRINYLGKQQWAAFRNGARGVRERDGAFTLDIGGRYVISRNLSVKVAILNVTDKIVPIDDRGRNGGLNGNWLVDEGRRAWLSLNGTF